MTPVSSLNGFSQPSFHAALGSAPASSNARAIATACSLDSASGSRAKQRYCNGCQLRGPPAADAADGSAREPALDLDEIAGDDGRVQATARDVGMLAQDMRRERAVGAVERVAQEIVSALHGAAFRELAIREQLLERGPTGQAVLEGERVLHVSQRGLGAGSGRNTQQPLARRRVGFAQRFEPALRFFLQ